MPKRKLLAITTVIALLACSPLTAAEGEAPATVSAIKVLPDKAPDCTSLKTIVESVTRGCRTNDEKAIAIYNFMRMTHYHRAYPSEPGGIPVLKEINCYGWSLCGGLHAEQSALWREMGWEWRFVGWPGHTTVEAYYDGGWHYLDVFLKFYAWMPDPRHPGKFTIAGEDDLASNPQVLLFDAFVTDPERKVLYARGNEFQLLGERANWQAPAFLVCGDSLPDIATSLQKRNRVGPSDGWAGMNHATGSYSAEINLAPGFALTNTWDKAPGAWYWEGSQVEPCHTCGDKEIRNSPEKGPLVEPYLGRDWTAESYANGQLDFRPDFSTAACLRSFSNVENVKVENGSLVPAEAGKPACVTVPLQSPYIFTQAHGSGEGIEAFEISRDGGKTWKPAELADFGKSIAGQTRVLARITIRDRLRNLHLQATVQNNPFALPYLSPGKNTVTVSVADPKALGDNRLVVTYAYRRGARRKSYEQLYLEGKEIARAHDASWEKTPTVVQKVFTAADLPAMFDIDVPTPKGEHPVYPRMLFVRREVLAPNQQPLPLPADSQAASLRPGDQLLTLPNPLLVGTQPPPKAPTRTVITKTLPLRAGQFVSKSGSAPAGDLLKWPKNNQEQVESIAFLIDGDLKQLPPLKSLAAARLVVPITGAHPQASTKLGVTALKSPFEAGKSFDFSQLGDVLSTAIVPKHPDDAPRWNPPQEFRLDVTRQVRSIVHGDVKFHGFGLRVVPDRAVDDGWTVRVHLPKEPQFVLEIDTYADEP
jgi:hypothetical protein